MICPVNYIAIVRGFNSNEKSKNFHKGLDLGFYSNAHKYQPIYAAMDGEIIYKKIQKSGGLVLHIKHNGYVSSYGHLDTWCVDLGQKVKKGQKIGTMGASGEVSGMHLHFGLCKGDIITYTKKDKWVDPLDFICVFSEQKIKNLKTKLMIKYHSRKAKVDLWIHKSKDYKKSSRVFSIKKGEEIEYYGKSGNYAVVDNINKYYCANKYLKK